jgi:hypothetical protein
LTASGIELATTPALKKLAALLPSLPFEAGGLGSRMRFSLLPLLRTARILWAQESLAGSVSLLIPLNAVAVVVVVVAAVGKDIQDAVVQLGDLVSKGGVYADAAVSTEANRARRLRWYGREPFIR